MRFSKEARRVVIVGIVAFLLGGYTYVTMPERRVFQAQGEPVPDRPVFTFNPDRITKFSVASSGKHIAGERTANGWRTPEGSGLPSVAVDDFLTNLTKLVNLGEVERGIDDHLADYGLEPPESHILLTVTGEGERSLTIGKHNPVNTSLYALVNESRQVILIGSIISWELRKLMDAIQSTANAA
ncbi:MAG: DUF4340 domain-containing protein [Candidatus Binatia bacterium]